MRGAAVGCVWCHAGIATEQQRLGIPPTLQVDVFAHGGRTSPFGLRSSILPASGAASGRRHNIQTQGFAEIDMTSCDAPA
jgi:hypothetical protein